MHTLAIEVFVQVDSMDQAVKLQQVVHDAFMAAPEDVQPKGWVVQGRPMTEEEQLKAFP